MNAGGGSDNTCSKALNLLTQWVLPGVHIIRVQYKQT